jgi:hypothetical protein
VQTLNNIHDVLAVRIIVPSKLDCYHTMRVLGNHWRQVPDREKNYIRTPKANGYQSIHKVLVSDAGVPIEVQVRTPQMHWNAEYGVASHWRYKDRKSGKPGSCSSHKCAQDAVMAAHEQLVAWSRMQLTYGHGVRDYRKSCGAVNHRRSSTLSEVTHALMASSHSGVDNGDLACRGRNAERSAARVPRSSSVCGTVEEPAPARRMSFEDFVASSMSQPAALKSVFVAVSWVGGADIRSLDAVVGSSSVGRLLRSGGRALNGVTAAQILVNGMPALGDMHPLTMGDCVRVLPSISPAAIAAVSREYLCSMPRPIMLLRQELSRAIAYNMGHTEPVHMA